MIRAIDRSSVQKICSGQVVVDLATAVKEMVENSLDSGATSVEVRLKEMGALCIEVSDNGTGIDPSNYEGIARKHFTSKLQSFEDIYSVSSFGFRGEALNALCELSEKFTVTTKQENQAVGTILEFDRNGQLISQGVAARTNGTTVTVENLFEKLPVRRKEFVKSIKKHFQKMVRVIQSYALISVGVKIFVTNTSAAGVKQTVFTTQSGGKLSDNVSILFGAKFAASMLSLELEVPLGASPKQNSSSQAAFDCNGDDIDDQVDQSDEVSPTSVSFSSCGDGDNTVDRLGQKDRLSNTNSIEDLDTIVSLNKVHVKGLVSKVGLGVGRSDNDRQFMFVNGRPVDLPRFAKVLNEVWRRYEMKQKPAFVLDVTVPAGFFDVNLTPDKREVLIVQEALVLEKLRECVDCMYQPVRQTMQLNQGVAQKTLLTSLWSEKSEITAASLRTAGATETLQRQDQQMITVDPQEDFIENHEMDVDNQRIETLFDLPGSPSTVWATPMDRERFLRSPSNSSRVSTTALVVAATARSTSTPESATLGTNLAECRLPSRTDPVCSPSLTTLPTEVKARKTVAWSMDVGSALQKFRARLTNAEPNFDDGTDGTPKSTTAFAVNNEQDNSFGIDECMDSDCDVYDIKNNVPSASESASTAVHKQNDNEDRTQARVLHKKDFPKMKIAGQFNLGFIIAELNGDLYILDQHACDEKYRFEELQRTTQIHQQPLIRPLPVETSASLELVIAEHQHVFEANGFRLRVDLSANAGQRVKLLGVPFSKSIHFGVDDVNELASMISDRAGNSTGELDSTSERVSKTYLALKNDVVSDKAAPDKRSIPRLPKLVAMYASRACRSAIMIGSAMKLPEMDRVVHRLEGVEQPWNCPHGRPTLRHLVDLAPLREARKRKIAELDV